MNDLNQLKIQADTLNHSEVQLSDYQTASNDGKTDVYFRNIETHLLRHIAAADVVLGCVAWLTSEPLLKALAKKQVSLIVQKEDFLRPDADVVGHWKSRLRDLYSAIPATLCRYDEGFQSTSLYGMSCATDPTIDAIRCVGNLNSSKSPAFPRAHHKFVVFCKQVDVPESEFGGGFAPYEVWTGSFNFTKNATASLENAVAMRDLNVVGAYFREYSQIAAISEPLNWTKEWVAPEWRIGT